MNSANDLLINQLDSMSQVFASFARVIIHATEWLTKASCTHDFSHSEAVHQRLSELLPHCRQFGLTEAETFILIASAYLHDIGHSETSDGPKHGELSAKRINTDDSLKYLFPSGDIRNQVAKICYYHDREINDLGQLEKEIHLDIRPCHSFKRSQIKVRPRMLGSIFRLADELECNSDRLLVQSPDSQDPRMAIAGVRLDLGARYICLDFKQGAKEEYRNQCAEYLRGILEMLGVFLDPHGLSFKIIDKLPERESIDEEEDPDTQTVSLDEESADEQLIPLDDVEDDSKTFVQPQKIIRFDDLMTMYKKERMNRIDSITSFLSERSNRQ